DVGSGVPSVRLLRAGAGRAAVAIGAVRRGRKEGAGVVLVDNASRLQNRQGLMDELGKIRRVITKEAPLAEVLLVLDATTGQNGLNQARAFGEVAGVTGIVLTKLDGTARGGIVVAVQRELGVPVKLVRLGGGPDGLAPFGPGQFVDGLLGDGAGPAAHRDLARRARDRSRSCHVAITGVSRSGRRAARPAG